MSMHLATLSTLPAWPAAPSCSPTRSRWPRAALRRGPSVLRPTPLHRQNVRHMTNVLGKIMELLGGGKTPSSRAIEVEDEDGSSDMARIDTSSREGLGGATKEAFGPLAVLLVGYMHDELEAFQHLLGDMDAGMIKVVPCTKAMLSGTLGQALEATAPAYELPPLGTRRALVLSGMYGSEVVELISAYKEAGLPPCAFAGAVPNNYDRNLGDLLQEVHGDQEAMMLRQQQQQQK